MWALVTGTDIIRDNDGTFYVLEDNLCVPSGVSYARPSASSKKDSVASVRPVSYTHLTLPTNREV